MLHEYDLILCQSANSVQKYRNRFMVQALIVDLARHICRLTAHQ
jgi:hypothetical protein